MPFLRHATSDAKNVLVGRGSSATQAKRVMVGTGSSSVEVWPGVYDVNMDFGFATIDELKWAPITGFDSRTSSSSPLAPGFVFNDMFVAGDNSSATYYTRLVDQEVDQLPLTFTVTLGDIPNDVSRPAWVVLSANLTLTHMLIAEFGRDGFRVFALVNGSTTPSTPYRYSQTYQANDQLIITLSSDRVLVGKIGGSQTAYASPTMINTVRSGPGRMYFGFGTYSTTGHWGSRIQRIQIEGKTTQKRVLAASEDLARVSVPSTTWSDVATSVIAGSGRTSVALVGGSWAGSSTSVRIFRILRNGIELTRTTSNVGHVQLNNVTLNFDDVITVEAQALGSNRTINGGSLRIGDPALFT